MAPILLTGLLKIEQPGRDVLLCDGGTVTYDGDVYTGRDSLLGVVAGYEALTEGVGDEAPAILLTFLPPDDAPASALNSAANQGARMRIWIAEVDAATGAIIGAPEQQADMIVDYPNLTVGVGKRELELAFVSGGDRLFQLNRGNSLSPVFHRGIHPGEAGLDNASGVETAVPWGAPSAPRGTAAGSGGYAGSIGGGSGGLGLARA